MDSKSNSTDLHEASFSSYLTQEENFVHKLRESVQFTHPAFTSSQETSIPISLGRTKHEEREISVFDAEKYFSMKIDGDVPRIIDTLKVGKYVHENENRVDLRRNRPQSRLGTPSVSSEASWCSQTALLPTAMRNPTQSRHQKVIERWFFSGFACNGSCSDKKSVYTVTNVVHRGLHGKEFKKEPTQVARSPIMSEGRKQPRSTFQAKDFRSPSFDRMSIDSRREGYLLLPTVNSGVQGLRVQREEYKMIEDDPRKSLEVFGSRFIKKEDIALNLERKLSVLTCDAIPKAPDLPTISASRQVYEDAESDASSDLFEIEDISSSTQQMFVKQTSDVTSGCMTPSGYEPSETSVEWSAVTASAADFSAASDYDEKIVAENGANPGFASTTRKGRPNSLLGCKSQKAVDVAETAYKRNDKAKSHLQLHTRPDIPRPVRKLQADIMVKDIDFP